MIKQYKRRLARGAVAAALLLLASGGCSRSTPTSSPGSLDGGLGSSSGGGPNTPLDTSNMGGGSSSTLAIPSPAPVTAQQQYCLTQNSALSNGFGVRAATAGGTTGTATGGTYTNGYTNGSTTAGGTTSATTQGSTTGTFGSTTGAPGTTSALSCYNGAATQDPSSIYNAGLQSLQFMGQCYSQVAKYQPPANAAPQDIASAFSAAQAQMIQCYRGILAQQQQFANWNAPQQQNYDTQNQALFVLLSILQAQH